MSSETGKDTATFPQTLAGLRSSAGFATARGFYLKSGGARTLGCTYKAYSNIERGLSLPKPELAHSIAVTLGLWERPEDARSFLTAYIDAVAGGGHLSRLLAESLRPPGSGHPAASLLQRAVSSSFTRASRLLSFKQVEMFNRSAEHYWAFHLLSDDTGSWSVQRLARTAGLSASRLRAALEELSEAGLLRRERSGRFSSPFAGTVLVYPRDKLHRPIWREPIVGYWRDMGKKRGGTLLSRYVCVRAREADVQQYFHRLRQTVHSAHVYYRTEGGPGTSMIGIQARVRRLLRY